LTIRYWKSGRLISRMCRIRSLCCIRAPSGHAAAAPPNNVMNSRRLMGLVLFGPTIIPQHIVQRGLCCTSQQYGSSCPFRVTARRTLDEHMSSALPPIAAEGEPCQHLRSAPQGDMQAASLALRVAVRSSARLLQWSKMGAVPAKLPDARSSRVAASNFNDGCPV